MFSLDNLTSLVKKRKRVGRGGSRGGTSGKGSKGQKARSGGGVRVGFEGGQMPLVRRLPKRGFNNKRFQDEVTVVSLKMLDQSFDENMVVDVAALREKKIIKGKKQLFVKVLASGALTKKITVCAHAFSEEAKKAIETLGGEARIIKEM